MANAATLEIAVEVDSKTGKLKLKALGDTGQNSGNAIARAFKKAGKATNEMDRKVKQSIHNYKALSGTVATLAGIGGLGMLAKNAIDTASSFEQLEMRLDVLTRGKGKDTLERLNKWALDMPVNTQDAVDAFVMMNAMGLDPTIEKLQILVDTGVIFGDETMKRVTRALGQMQALGKVSAEELNQLSEAGINARKYLKHEFGMTVEEIQQSGIKIEAVIQAIMDGMEREFKGASIKGQKTWRGMTTAFQSYWMELNRKVMDAGVFDYLKDELNDINSYMAEWIENNEVLIQQKVPEYIAGIKSTVKSTYDFISSNPALIEFGLVGMIIGGKKGALALGALGYADDYISNLYDALKMNEAGLIKASDILSAGFSNTALNKLMAPHKSTFDKMNYYKTLMSLKKRQHAIINKSYGFYDWSDEYKEDMRELDAINQKIDKMETQKAFNDFNLQLRKKKDILQEQKEVLQEFESFEKSLSGRYGDKTTGRNANKIKLTPAQRYSIDKADQQTEDDYRKARDEQNRQFDFLLMDQERADREKIKIASETYDKLADIHKEATEAQRKEYEVMKGLAKDFAMGANRILEDYFFSAFTKGTFDMGKAFETMIYQMAASFMATSLTEGFFGENGLIPIKSDLKRSVSDRKRSVSRNDVTLNIFHGGNQVDVRQTTPNEIDVIFDQVDQYMANGIHAGNTKTASALKNTYNIARK